METVSRRRLAAELIAASFVVLFQELALIRWFPGQVRVLAYFPNVILISAFLGLGVGSLLSGRRSFLPWWPLSLVVTAAAGVGMGRIAFTNRSATEHLWLLYHDLKDAPVLNDVRPPIIVAFLLSMLTFIPLGQYVGERLKLFSSAGVALSGYIYDLTGSLLGVIGFALASFFRTFPIVWFSVVVIVGGLFLVPRRRRVVLSFVAGSAILLLIIGLSERASFYSPYYALDLVPSKTSAGVSVLANGSLHQYAAPLRRSETRVTPYEEKVRTGYPLPYTWLRRPPESVLILGAGTGNDVSTALEHSNARIDAVEIDPVIVELGRKHHPDNPYASPRVTVIIDDARAYLRNTDKRYDLIVFGTLDSMTRLSALANVRLDNFVYTVEALRSARERLTPDGGIALYFMVGNEWLDSKLTDVITEATGRPPIIWSGSYNLFNTIYLSGPAWEHLRRGNEPVASSRAALPTDDWPYLYLQHRSISGFYWSMVFAIALMSFGIVAVAQPKMFTRGQRIDGEMFLFGLAFLLLETKLVTQMSLIWGATWITSAVVFGSVLLMTLLGTVLTKFRPMRFEIAFAALVAALIGTYLVPTEWLLAESVPLRLLLSIIFAGLPILFTSICFAVLFQARAEVNVAFGWNLLGAVTGGLLEYASMYVGFRALSMVALAAYLGAYLISRIRARESATA